MEVAGGIARHLEGEHDEPACQRGEDERTDGQLLDRVAQQLDAVFLVSEDDGHRVHRR